MYLSTVRRPNWVAVGNCVYVHVRVCSPAACSKFTWFNTLIDIQNGCQYTTLHCQNQHRRSASHWHTNSKSCILSVPNHSLRRTKVIFVLELFWKACFVKRCKDRRALKRWYNFDGNEAVLPYRDYPDITCISILIFSLTWCHNHLSRRCEQNSTFQCNLNAEWKWQGWTYKMWGLHAFVSRVCCAEWHCGEKSPCENDCAIPKRDRDLTLTFWSVCSARASCTAAPKQTRIFIVSVRH
jgi:hypothetical protein